MYEFQLIFFTLKKLAQSLHTAPMTILNFLILNSLQLFGSVTSYIWCEVSAECKDAVLSYSEDLLCYGYHSCDGATISLIDANLHCTGHYACAFATISVISNNDQNTLILYGYHACKESTMHIINSNVQCNGHYTCWSAVITMISTNQDSIHLYCLGLHSCRETNISATTAVSNNGCMYCQGSHSCLYIKLTDAANDIYYLDCSGYAGCLHSFISGVEIIHANSHYSIANANITSKQIGPRYNNSYIMEVYAYGYHSGFNSNIFCQETHHVCKIFCLGNGCYNMFLHGNGTFIVDCDISSRHTCPNATYIDDKNLFPSNNPIIDTTLHINPSMNPSMNPTVEPTEYSERSLRDPTAIGIGSTATAMDYTSNTVTDQDDESQQCSCDSNQALTESTIIALAIVIVVLSCCSLIAFVVSKRYTFLSTQKNNKSDRHSAAKMAKVSSISSERAKAMQNNRANDGDNQENDHILHLDQ